MARSGEIRSKWSLDMAQYYKSLDEGLKRTQSVAEAIKRSLGESVTVPTPSAATAGGGRGRVDPAIAQQREQVRQYRDAQNALRTELERGVITNGKYITSARTLQKEMLTYQTTLPRLSKEWSALDRAIAMSERGISTAAGQISKLGLSQQVAIGVQRQFAASLASQTGPIGNATLGLVAMNGGLGAVSAGAALAGGAILGTGVATAALVQRGVPQVKSFQNSINVLAASGAQDLDKLDQKLIELQESAGRAGRQFSRSELAAALAETTKAGVDADAAFEILRSSIQLAAAEGADLTQSTSLVLKAIRQYGLEVGDAATVTDKLAQAGLLAASNTTDISTGLSRVAGTGRAAGVEMSDLIGMIVELDNKGLEAADRGANALNSALAAIAGITPQAKDQLKAWNIEVDNSDGSARLAGDILADLGDKLRLAGVQYDESTGQLTGNGDALRGLARIMGTEGARAVLNLTGQWRDYAREIESSEGVSREFADQMTQGLSPAQASMSKALDDLAKTAAEVFAPGIIAGADAVATLVRNIDDVLNKAGPLDSKLKVLFGADEIKVLEQDLKNAKTQIDGFNKKLEVLRGGPKLFGAIQLPKSILGNPEELQQQITEYEQHVADAEAQVTAINERLAALYSGEDVAATEPAPLTVAELPFLNPAAAGLDPETQGKYEQAVRDAQDAATQAAISAMQEGTAKINATYHERLEVERRAFEQLTAGLSEDSEIYQQLLTAFNIKTGAIRSEGLTALEQDAEQRLETQRQLTQDLAALQGQVNVAAAEASGNVTAAINARSLEQARQIEVERQQMLARVEGNDQASRDRRVQINALYDVKERQNTQQLTRDLEAEHKRRTDSLEAIAERTAELQAQTRAAEQRGQGDEAGAVQTELAARLKAIDDALSDELDAEGTTQAEITALHLEANAQRVAARQQAALATKAAIQQERDAAKQALAESDQQLRQAEQGDVQGEIPRLRAQFAAEQAERRTADKQRLADFKGTEEERKRLISDASQREIILTRQNLLQINRLDKDARAEYAQAVKDYQKEVTDAYVGALQTQIGKLKELRDTQMEVVSSGSTILQFIKNREELTGGAGGANETQIDNFLNSQLNGYEKLYRESLKANGPLEERVELQEKIKTLLDDAKSEGYSLTLDPSIVRLMEGDEISQVANFPRKAAEALQNTKALDERIAEATAKLTDLLGVAATDQGLNLKVTVDKSGLEQARETLVQTLGPDEASKIGTRAGAGFTGALADSITANKSPVISAIRDLLAEVDQYLPHSDARRGPLSRLSHSGRAIPRTLAENMRRELSPLRTAAGMVAASARPSLSITAIPTSRPAYFPTAAAGVGGASGMVIEKMYVDGGKIQPSTQDEMAAGRLLRQIERSADLRRRGYK